MTKILIIEDNIDIRENVVEILGLSGYRAYAAENGKVGVELARKHKPDLILSDIMMPEMDGYGVLEELQKHEATRMIPFIFITAKSERPDIRRGMDMGADDYLTKPFDDTELLNAIETRLRKKESQSKFYSKAMESIEKLVEKKSGLEELKKIIEDRKLRTFKKNQDIYHEGDRATGVYLLISGKVKTVKMTEDGREFITGMFDADSFIGINALFSNELFTDTATALTDSELIFFPKDQFEGLINLYPDVAGKFIRILSNEIREKENHLIQMAYQSVRKRIADAIIRVYNQHNKGKEISITRDDLAALSGTAPETVSRTLTDFKSEGLISKKGSVITILEEVKLDRLKN